jgi:hypothetical protein
MCFHGSKTQTIGSTRRVLTLIERLRAAGAKAAELGLSAQTPIFLKDAFTGDQKVGDLVNANSLQEVSNMVRNLRSWHPEYADAERYVPDFTAVNEYRQAAAVIGDVSELPSSRGRVPRESDTERKIERLSKAA